MRWKFAIQEIDETYPQWALVELYLDGEIEGNYATILDGGESRSDIVHTLQLMVCDTFSDEEMQELEKMFAVRKEVKALRGEV